MKLVPKVSFALPAKDESKAVGATVQGIRSLFPEAEVLVIDDGSEDDTAAVARAAGASVITHPYSMGNGAAIKTGARHATGEVIVFMDADGQHDPADIPRLLERLEQGFDMVVGARGNASQASMGRGLANRFYNRLASWMVGQRVQDLTSGFRAVKSDKFREFGVRVRTLLVGGGEFGVRVRTLGVRGQSPNSAGRRR
jgi:glycosyltransferase involved in cell wall biosynthesis